MSIKDTLTQIESRMAGMKAEIDVINARMEPIDAEIDALIEQEQAIRARMAEATERLNQARGEPQAYLKLKREYGVLAATRMQLRSALPALE